MIEIGRIVTLATIATLLAVLPSFGTHAQTLTTEQYRHPKTEKDLNTNKAYLAGAKDALLAYNNSAEDKLFCMPGIPVLTFDQANDIAMRWARKKSVNADNLPLSLVLLYGLRETFPCSK